MSSSFKTAALINFKNNSMFEFKFLEFYSV